MQYKAPIRSQALSPMIPGNVLTESTGQCKGTFANPSTGQIRQAFKDIVD